MLITTNVIMMDMTQTTGIRTQVIAKHANVITVNGKIATTILRTVRIKDTRQAMETLTKAIPKSATASMGGGGIAVIILIIMYLHRRKNITTHPHHLMTKRNANEMATHMMSKNGIPSMMKGAIATGMASSRTVKGIGVSVMVISMMLINGIPSMMKRAIATGMASSRTVKGISVSVMAISMISMNGIPSTMKGAIAIGMASSRTVRAAYVIMETIQATMESGTTFLTKHADVNMGNGLIVQRIQPKNLLENQQRDPQRDHQSDPPESPPESPRRSLRRNLTRIITTIIVKVMGKSMLSMDGMIRTAVGVNGVTCGIVTTKIMTMNIVHSREIFIMLVSIIILTMGTVNARRVTYGLIAATRTMAMVITAGLMMERNMLTDNGMSMERKHVHVVSNMEVGGGIVNILVIITLGHRMIVTMLSRKRVMMNGVKLLLSLHVVTTTFRFCVLH